MPLPEAPTEPSASELLPSVWPEPIALRQTKTVGGLVDGAVSPVQFTEPSANQNPATASDLASSPQETPANPLRRDDQGFVLPEGEIAAPAAARVTAGQQVSPPVTAEGPSARTAMLPRAMDRLPARETDDMREILRKESVGDIIGDALAPQQPVTEPAQAAVDGKQTRQAWCEPKTLLDALEKLTKEKAARPWAEPVQKLVVGLGREIAEGSPKAEETIGKLDAAVADAATFAAQVENPSLARRIRQAGFAASRRLDVWRQLTARPDTKAPSPEDPLSNNETLLACLAQIDSITAGSREGLAWRQYLLADALRERVKKPDPAGDEASRQLALEVLRRMARASMSPEQKRFLSSEPLTSLQGELRRKAYRPMDYAALLSHIEQFEQTRSPSDASRLAEDIRILGLSPQDDQQQLARRLETHDRNANLRLAVSEKLLNRLMPQRPAETAPVYDNFNGIDVFGESVTTQNLAVRLLPSPNRVRMALEVNGQVNSLTTSSSGPATFTNNGTAYYVARKPLEVDMRGIRMEPTQIEVRNDIRLQNVETTADGVPIVGLVVQGFAKREHEKARPEAAREMRGKIAATARQRVDKETTARLQEFAARFNENVLEPLNALQLQPIMVSAETTPERFLTRLRLAGDDQLGSHTPRPQAPSDSLASVQIHESAINNAIQRLELDGRTFTLPELAKHIAVKYHRLEAFEVNPENEDVVIKFAQRDAVQVQCEDGQIIMNLAIARLSKGSRAWKDFQVRAFYKPLIDGRRAELARDGVIHLKGQKLNTGAQIALRGIFAKAFSRKTPWILTPETVMKNPALADLAISQFAIDDGWIGAALGPKPMIVNRPAILRRQ